MALLDNIKPGIDIPRWQQMSPITIHAAGSSLCADKRNDTSAILPLFHLVSAAIFNMYVPAFNGYSFVINPGLSAFGAGSATIFCPSMGPRGSIGAGCTVSKIVTTTVISPVAQNDFVYNEQWGYKIRIIGLASGLIEERAIVGNTAGTTPTFYLNQPLSFVPAVGDLYEILCGRVYMLGTTAGATQFRYYDLGTQVMVSAGNTTLTIATDSSMQCLDELYVPYDRKPGEGFLIGAGTYDAVGVGTSRGCLTATAMGAGSLTGEALAGDFGVYLNEYRNFQIRIVEDVGTPVAVGQRRTIASHTAGPSPVYTLGTNWATQPSATAKYVIENPNVILLFTVAAGTATYTYNYTPVTINNGTNTIASGAFSSTYFGARGTVVAAGTFSLPCWSHEPSTIDGQRLSRHSHIYSFRGGGALLDLLDIAGGVTGLWTNDVKYQPTLSFTTGSGGRMASVDQQGQWGYIILNNTNAVYRFNVKYRGLHPWATLPAQAGTAAVGERIEIASYMTLTETDKMSMIFVQGHLATTLYRSEVIL